MPLVIEDGSLPTGANSFVTVAEVRAFAEVRASNLPGNDAAIESDCFRAMDFLRSLSDQYKGNTVSATQPLPWPRSGVFIHGWELAANAIPQALKDAQCQLVVDADNGLDLQPSSDGREIIREKVDVLETEYRPGSANAQPTLTKARAFLAPLLKTGGGLLVSRA